MASGLYVLIFDTVNGSRILPLFYYLLLVSGDRYIVHMTDDVVVIVGDWSIMLDTPLV